MLCGGLAMVVTKHVRAGVAYVNMVIRNKVG